MVSAKVLRANEPSRVRRVRPSGSGAVGASGSTGILRVPPGTAPPGTAPPGTARRSVPASAGPGVATVGGSAGAPTVGGSACGSRDGRVGGSWPARRRSVG
ncbi:hypothetical protein GCM10009836_57380 [Pseudonocardia ailaonensis]|uniref:Uncharacterized protein n=1 Tax=Pseudonocardia ailaonensis TaxID=367279 RepID=A0ABN2NHB3_9PSEU